MRGTIVEREIKRSLENGVRIEYEFYILLTNSAGLPSVILVFRDLTNRENR